MKSKKGFMLGEYTLKMIIAVLCILLLIYLLFSLYSNNKDQKNLQLAEASLNELVKGMEEAKERGSAEVLILNPNQEPAIIGELWVIIAWPINDKERPNKCTGDCICICTTPKTYEKLPFASSVNAFLKECSTLGVCKNFESKIKVSNSGILNYDWQIPIKDPPVSLNIRYENGELIITKK